MAEGPGEAMTDTWPPRWDGPQFKGAGPSSKVLRRQRKRDDKREEEKNKATVRRRDRDCRFPLCGCKALKIMGHVAHRRHKGSGGNPARDRSCPADMILVCACRHRENRISLDRGTLRWEGQSNMMANGLVTWEILTSELPKELRTPQPKLWTPIWREGAIGKGVPVGPKALHILKWLASMEV